MQVRFPNARILIVDDEKELRDLYSDLLQKLTPHIETAENGRYALEKFKGGKFSAIISDISMPEMNGLELLENVRKSDKVIPFIVLTGFGEKSSAIRALRAGAFDFLEKPVKNQTLLDSITNAIRSKVDQENTPQNRN